MPHHSASPPRFGALACAVLTCVVVPPVRGATQSTQAGDGGGCNGGREVPVTWDDSDTSDPSSTGEPEDTTAGGQCGDGMQDPGEACDDGNQDDGDACPSGAKGSCEAAAVCGDGMVWAGEEACDDGNRTADDGCEADCSVTPSECGDGVVEGAELCDDGNTEDTDACPSGVGACKGTAVCGDGYVQAGVEGCDDGNGADDDACPSGLGACAAAAVCGDGYVQTGVEGCDDGNTVDEDACPSGTGACVAAAVCGDGFVQDGVEECDDGDEEDLNECSGECVAPRWVFITSGAGPMTNGNLGGIAGADAYCQMLAEAASLPGTYKAWLTGSDPASAPATRFASAEFNGWYRLRTEPPTGVAKGWVDLTSPNDGMPTDYLKAAISVDEKGSDVGDSSVWTNTKPDGTRADAAAHCGDWTTNDAVTKGISGRGKSGVVDMTWTVFLDGDKCSSGSRLYCFQV